MGVFVTAALVIRAGWAELPANAGWAALYGTSIGRDDHPSAFVQPADQAEEQLATGLGQRADSPVS
jgi:hypothetical protein